MLEFNDVSLVYPNGRKGLKNINLNINERKFVVIVGLSGARKSTFIRSINRLIISTSGSLIADEEAILKTNGESLQKNRDDFQRYNLVKR